MASYLAQEVQLARRHDEILSQRSVLLQQMETHLGDKKTEKTLQMLAADAAYKRNAALLNDIEAAEKRLQAGLHLQPHPDIVKIELKKLTQKLHLLSKTLEQVYVRAVTLYWASVEESIPKWEQFLLGRAQAPVGFKKKKSSEYNISHAKVAAQR